VSFLPACLATIIGSLPHRDAQEAVKLILKYTPEIPAWPQLPKLPHENMMIQFTESMPGFVERDGSAYFDTSSSTFEEELLAFYEKYITASEGGDQQALEGFRMSPEYASGLYEFLTLPDLEPGAVAVKGQITGPITLGTSLTDQDRRCAYYDSRLREVLVKSLAMKVRWQIQQLRRYDLPVIIFIDEPSMQFFGSSAFVGISREDVIRDLNEVMEVIHGQGGIAGIHCCGNTDWSLILTTEVDILSFDAYEFFDRLALYADELKEFVNRGGIISWGITPTLQKDRLPEETADSLVSRFESEAAELDKRGIAGELILRQSLITPSCGMRGLSEEMAVFALKLTRDVSYYIRNTLMDSAKGIGEGLLWNGK
jgi:methionine synthase II (cobalamin-independent)